MFKGRDIFETISREGNFAEFYYSGYRCLILREDAISNPENTTMYNLSGFVVIDSHNPLYHCHHADPVCANFNIRLDLNYSGSELNDLFIGSGKWVLGFSCNDKTCAVTKEELILSPEKYKTMDFVRKELRILAGQLREYADHAEFDAS